MLALIPLVPLIGFLINGSWYAFFQTGKNQKPVGATVPGIIASGALLVSFLVALNGFLTLSGMPEGQRVIEQTLFPWMTIGSFNLNFSLVMDPLSSLFCLVITGVGFLIHVYSIGYMHDDATPAKYFSYLNLFCFAMLILVLGSSLPVMFLGWEGVGLCSYLLIGYWYEDDEKASAGKKAFIVNRIGDLGFLLGMFLIFTTFGSLEFHEIQQAVASKFSAGLPDGMGLTITLICLFLFIGCTGKSAQIPLYVWLPDAMAGPTPVSALIHAATMVTSGIYLLARLNFLYSMSDVALMVVAWVGALTALFAATMAIAQTDIKKVLAYSTVSQLGYMFLACGVAGYTAGVFHVITHAFFKALLFLGAGSVIYGMHHEQNILKMGGLKSKMPRTYLVFMIGWLAICGVVPFSGFFSKDEILWLAYSSEHGSIFLWMIGALTAVMTAFYMTRLFSLTFLGQHRGAHDHGDHGHGHAKHGAHDHGDHGHHEVHESPNVMVIPLMVLALLSAIGGFMGIPHASWLEHWLAQVIPAHAHGPMPAMEWVLMGLSLTGAGIGIFLGLKLYSDLKAVERMKQKWASLHKLLENKWYVDEIYNAIIVQPLIAFSKKLWTLFDVGVIDRIVLGFGRISAWTGQQSRVVQTGSLQVYAFVLLLGLFLSLGYMIYGMV